MPGRELLSNLPVRLLVLWFGQGAICNSNGSSRIEFAKRPAPPAPVVADDDDLLHAIDDGRTHPFSPLKTPQTWNRDTARRSRVRDRRTEPEIKCGTLT